MPEDDKPEQRQIQISVTEHERFLIRTALVHTAQRAKLEMRFEMRDLAKKLDQ